MSTTPTTSLPCLLAPDAVTLPSPSTSKTAYKDVDDADDADDADDEAIEEACQAVRTRFNGQNISANNDLVLVFHAGQPSYDRFVHRLQEQGLADFFEKHVRHHWSARSGELVLRVMANIIHDQFRDSVILGINRQLDAIQTPTARELRQQIVSGGTGYIDGFNGPKRTSRRSPDGQFYFGDDDTPIFVLEIAYSQTNLRDVMKAYFREHSGVGAVLGFNVTYKTPTERIEPGHHAGFVSLWVADVRRNDQPSDVLDVDVRQVLGHTAFRDNDGRPLPGHLVIPFHLLLPLRERSTLLAGEKVPDIYFSFVDLAELLAAAERRQRQRDIRSKQPAAGVSMKTRITFLDEEDGSDADTRESLAKETA